MHQPLDVRLLALIGTLAVNFSALILLYYRPQDLHPRSYDMGKWFGVLLGFTGVLILTYLVPAICFFVLAVAYAVVFKRCFAEMPHAYTQDDKPVVLIESTVFPVFAWLISSLSPPLMFFVLAGYYAYRLYAASQRVTALKDAQRKKRAIESVGLFARPVLRFLTRYTPDTYPPPISRRMQSAVATCAQLIHDLNRANGQPPNDLGDFDLLRSCGYPFTEHTFPRAWNGESTSNFLLHFMRVPAYLGLTASLTLEENQRYAAQLTDFFEARSEDLGKQAEAKLPAAVAAKWERVQDWLVEGLRAENGAKDFEEKMHWIAHQLTSLIPDYIAKTKTVIGTPPHELPIFYESVETRFYHTLLSGRSGRGKSTVITNIVAQDMHKGYGVIVMSPDEDLMHRIVPYIPEDRLDDVIYLYPGDTTVPLIGFNPFHFEPPADPEAYILLRNRTVGETFAVLERTLSIDTEPTKNLLNNAMYALIGRPNTTISDLDRLIDPKARTFHLEIANDPRVDPETQRFWRTYATEGANAMVHRNLHARILPLLRSPLYDIFSTQSVSLHHELNERSRIVLIDLSSFSRDSFEIAISAQLLIATLQQTILRRDKMPKQDYHPYFMYIDEFQMFAGTNERSIEAMTEQLRKYYFGLTLTTLAASRLGSLLDTLVGTVSNFICLGMSAKDSAAFAREMGIKRAGRDSFDAEALTTLQRGEAYVLTPPLQSAVFVTLPAEPPGNLPRLPTTVAEVRKRSKANFGAITKPLVPTEEDPAPPNEFVNAPDPPSGPPPPSAQPQQKASRPSTRKKRTRFDEDGGNPLIEIEPL